MTRTSWSPSKERIDTRPARRDDALEAPHRDDLVRQDRHVGEGSLNEIRYVLMDYFSPASIIGDSGAITERYGFSAFGIRRIMNPDWSPRSNSECDFTFAFQGQFLDPESGFFNYGYRYYSQNLGLWLVKDPIEEEGGLNLYSFVYGNPLNEVDRLGLRCGAYIIRNQPDVPVPGTQLKSSEGKDTLDGIEVEYTPCEPCPCPIEKIKLVQAVLSSGGTGEAAQMDATDAQRAANIYKTDPTLPPYGGIPGKHGLSYIDAPNNPKKLWGETIFTLEVCAVCKDGTDSILGCTTFTFGDKKRTPEVPGGKPRANGDGVGIPSRDPGKLWKAAIRQWNGMRKP